MSLFTSLQARVSTLGPLHLGAGTDYYPTGYVIKAGYLHAFSDQALLHGLGGSGLSQLAQLAEKGSEDSLLGIQRQIHASADRLMPLASHSVWVASGVAALYDSRIGQVAQRESGGRRIQNKLQIQRTFANPYNHQPVIPGSAIKGAIRTAWLDHLNQGQPAQYDPGNRRDGKESSQDLQKRLLDNRDVTDDPFSLLKISDAPYLHGDDIAATEVWFSISRKRRQLPNRSPQGVQNLLECIGPWRALAFAFDIRFMDASRALRKTTTRAPANPAELIAVCNNYYLPKLMRELEELGEREGYFSQEWQQPLQNLLSGELGQALSNGKAMLLRLGKHSGAEDKTLNGVRQIKIMTGQGKLPEYRDRTTEIRLAAHQPADLKNLLPFGWVLVEFPDSQLPQTHAFLRQQAEPAYKRKQQEDDWARTRNEMLHNLEQQALLERQRVEARAAAEAAEEQRLAERAALPLEQQAIDAFADKLAKDTASIGKGLGAPLAEDLRRLVADAERWSPEWRAAAHEVLQTAFAHLQVDRKNRKAKELLKRLADRPA